MNLLKNIRLLFCFEILVVAFICIRGYVKTDYPLYVPISIFVLAIGLLSFFEYRKRKVNEKEVVTWCVSTVPDRTRKGTGG
ncbi:hypothetical protein AAHB50_31405 [Bacillus toyonensis]